MTVTFWLLSAIIVPAALGVLFVRKAVHGALLLAVVMISLAVLYLTLEAPFLFAVQIIVYTGAILMLFLFVVMLVGVDASDSVVETIRGQRWLAWGAGVVMGALLLVAVAQISLGTVRGLEEANAGGNIEGLADLLFSRYVLAFEVTAALLITAAMGAMVLAHRERLTPKPTQASTAARRVRDYAESGKPLGPLPSPTRSTPRPCCRTARPPRSRWPGCSRPAAPSAPRPRWPTTSRSCDAPSATWAAAPIPTLVAAGSRAGPAAPATPVPAAATTPRTRRRTRE